MQLMSQSTRVRTVGRFTTIVQEGPTRQSSKSLTHGVSENMGHALKHKKETILTHHKQYQVATMNL